MFLTSLLSVSSRVRCVNADKCPSYFSFISKLQKPMAEKKGNSTFKVCRFYCIFDT